MPTLAIEIPEELMSQLRQQGRPVRDIVVDALRRHLQNTESPVAIPQTRTWQLCGTLEVREPTSVIGHDTQGHAITNEVAHIDDVLY